MLNFFIALLLTFCYLTKGFTEPSLSLHDKIGQMIVLGFVGKRVHSNSPIVKYIDKDNIGGVILFDLNDATKTFGKNIESPQQIKALNQRLQLFTQQSNIRHNRPQLPLIISIDYEGGKVVRLRSDYGFPKIKSAFEVAQSGLIAAKANAKLMADTLSAAGFNLNFSPVVDLYYPANPIIAQKGRSFSSDPYKVSQFASIYIHEFLNQHIQSAIKHFPGHGSSVNDSHLGFVDVTDTWKPAELIPYKELLNAHEVPGLIMVAHVVNKHLDKSGLPATLSYKILTEFLRNQLHFKGIIITDDLQMKAIADHYPLEKTLVLAINAGVDLLLFGNNLSETPQNPDEVIQIIEAKVRSGEISEKRINEAYQRIVEFKTRLVS